MMRYLATKRKLSFLLFLLFGAFHGIHAGEVSVGDQDLLIKINTNETVQLYIVGENFTIDFQVQHPDLVQVIPSSIDIQNNETHRIAINAIGAGHTEIIVNASKPEINTDNAFLRVTIYKIPELDTFSIVMGWIYFVAWSMSFFPQIYINFRRKSVVGLDFDFMAFNLIGFTLYSLFNLCLFYIPEIKDEYARRFPRGLNPIQVNDIFFALFALLCTLFIIGQMVIYERGNQKVSWTATGIISVSGVFIFISMILAATGVIHWLDFLYYCSYVKLATTLIKYVPQAYLNYKRQSCVGWSIYSVFCDITGGVTSLLQMFINAYNYDDWVSIFGDPTKFGLGLCSVVFDGFLMIQHFVFYRHSKEPEKS